ncbi:MAG: flagellar basal body P-ring formation chaperone FlgA [bacterium]|nr:flagellar basal body P-ring formation chaperone FlgA [bacterium]
MNRVIFMMLVHRLIGILCLILLTAGQALAIGRIEVKESVTLKGPEITLGDVARISDLPPELSAELKTLRLGRAPLPGQTRKIRANYLKIFLSRYDGAGFALDCPDQIEVITASQPLDVDALMETAYDALLEGLGLDNAECEMRNAESRGQKSEVRKQEDIGSKTVVEVVRRPKEMILPEGEVEFEIVSLPSPGTGTDWYTIPVKITVDGEEYRRDQVGFKVKQFQSVVVAVRHLDRHHLLAGEDLKIASKEIRGSSRKTFYQTPVELIGYQTKHSIQEGTPLTGDMVDIPPLIHRGDIVALESTWGRITVSALGQARSDGRAGERIAVLNCDSKKVVEGIVSSEGIVVVNK